jgi:hypothetical protein
VHTVQRQCANTVPMQCFQPNTSRVFKRRTSEEMQSPPLHAEQDVECEYCSGMRSECDVDVEQRMCVSACPEPRPKYASQQNSMGSVAANDLRDFRCFLVSFCYDLFLLFVCLF